MRLPAIGIVILPFFEATHGAARSTSPDKHVISFFKAHFVEAYAGRMITRADKGAPRDRRKDNIIKASIVLLRHQLRSSVSPKQCAIAACCNQC